MRRFEILDHTADIGIIAFGSTLPELFEHAAYGMCSLMFDLTGMPSSTSRPIAAIGDTIDDLLVGWLSEILAVAEIADLAFSAFVVDRLEIGGVQGSAGGVAASKLPLIGPPVKAVTYHELAVVETPDHWWARIIFDV
jgi:SHS2 domain-containing protein